MFSDRYDPFGFGGSPYFGDPFQSPYGSRRRQQELARRQRMAAEEERRRKAEHERRRRIEEEMARKEQQRRRREIEEEEMMRRRIAREKQRCGGGARALPYPPGTIVRGPDGNLYRIVAPPRWDGADDDSTSDIGRSDASISNKSSTSAEEDEENKENEEQDAASNMQFIATKDKRAHDRFYGSSEESGREDDLGDVSQLKSHTHEGHVYGPSVRIRAPAAAPLEEIVVENVPDEEDDELREMHSVWRNRVPSPGEWMEPVESFCG